MAKRKYLEQTIARAKAKLKALDRGAPLHMIHGDASALSAKEKSAVFDKLHAMCLEHFRDRFKEDYCEDNDSMHYIYEEAMQGCLGENVFSAMNKAP